jgi:TolA-binding protein
MEDATGVSSATARVPEAPSALPAEPATEGSADEAPSTPANSAPTPAVKGSNSRQDSWQTLVSRGQFQAVVAAAEARGIDACLQSCGVSDVRALADAARYTGHSSIAEQSLLAIRQRAPAGNQRSAAAFLLGRTSESGGQAASANGWYDNYLAESPNGEFAADALAGKMRVTVQTQGNAAARPLAMQYLQRYPNGVHADIARKIAGIR